MSTFQGMHKVFPAPEVHNPSGKGKKRGMTKKPTCSIISLLVRKTYVWIFEANGKAILMSIYDTLNPEQKEAVLYTEGPLLILAGAGCVAVKRRNII